MITVRPVCKIAVAVIVATVASGMAGRAWGQTRPATVPPTAAATTSPVEIIPTPSVAFEDGTVVRLVGVRHLPTPSVWWLADGSVLSEPVRAAEDVFYKSLGGFESASRRQVEFRLDMDLPAGGLGDRRIMVAINDGQSSRLMGAQSAQSTGPHLELSAVHSVPRASSDVELFAALASGDYRDTDSVTAKDSEARQTAAAPFVWTHDDERRAATQPALRPDTKTDLHILSVTGDARQTRVEYTGTRFWRDASAVDWRAVVVTKGGRVIPSKRVEHTNGRMSFVYDTPWSESLVAKYQTRTRIWESVGKVRVWPATQPVEARDETRLKP